MIKALVYAKIYTSNLRKKIMPRAMAVVLCGCLTFAVGQSSAQNSRNANDNPTAGQPRGEAQITLDLQDVDIRVLINTVAEVSGKNFIVDPRVKGKVSVISGASLNPEQLYDVFLSILEVHNFATVDSGNVIKVLPSNVIKQRPTPTLFSPTEDTNDSQITQIIRLNHASVQDLVPIVRPLIPPTSHFAPHVPSNSVVLTDTAANIQRVLKIIRRIDVPDKRSNVRVVYLEKTKASDIANTLTQLISTTADPKDAATASKVSIQPLDSINALVISSPDDQYAKIQALIDELDIERELKSDVNVIGLKHAKAEDLVSILNDVTATQTEGAVSQFSVQADEASNSLIVKASGNQLKTVQGVVAELDKRRAQVFVETVIAEVALNRVGEFGITLSAGGPRGGTDDTTDADGGTIAGTAGVGNLIDRDTGQVVGTGTIGTTFGLGTSGFRASLEGFEKYNLTAILNTLNSDTDSNVLSTPTILTLDNEEAEIVVGQEVPFITGRFNNGFNNNTGGGTDGNNGGINTGQGFQTIERRDVGIRLKIKPQISDGDTIQLEIEQEISSVQEAAIEGQADLITNRRSIEAIVQVDDGQVVVLGGLLVDNVSDTVNLVPILGRIPLIGALFRNTRKTSDKRNLMVFLKPRIIRTPEELASFSKEKYTEIKRDTETYRKESKGDPLSDLILNAAEPPVLIDYDKTTGKDGKLISERQARIAEKDKRKKNRPERTGINRLLFGKRYKDEGGSEQKATQGAGDDVESSTKAPAGFKTEGELESVIETPADDSELDQIEIQQELSDQNRDRINWGESKNGDAIAPDQNKSGSE